MINDKATFFKRLVSLPELKDNLLAVILAKRPTIDISKREIFFDNVSQLYSLHNINERQGIIAELANSNVSGSETWFNRDLRIKKIKLKSIKGFPASDTPFGIDFKSKESETSSMIVLGGNATGKSSVYDVLEYIYCKRIGEAELRSSTVFEDDDDKFKDFLRHLNNSFESSFCEVETASGKFALHEENIPKEVRAKINPNNHFVSDFNIYSHGKLDYSGAGQNTFHNLIASNIGLSELLQVEKNLYAFVSYGRTTESNRYNSVQKELESLQVRMLNNERLERETRQKLMELEKDAKSIPQPDSESTTLRDVLTALNASNYSFVLAAEAFKDTVTSFKMNFNQFKADTSQTRALTEIQFLEAGLLISEVHEDCPFCQNSNLQRSTIIEKVRARVDEMKKRNEASVALAKLSNTLVEIFEGFVREVNSLKLKVQREYTNIKNQPRLNQLIEIVSNFDVMISTYSVSDFFLAISSIEQNPQYMSNKFQFISDLIKEHETIGFAEMLEFTGAFNKFNEDRKLILNELKLQLDSIESPSTNEGTIAILKRDIENLKREDNHLKNNIINTDRQLHAAKEKFELYNRVKADAKTYFKVFHSELTKETQLAFEPIKNIVIGILGEYLYEEERPVDLIIERVPEETDPVSGEVISEIITAFVKERKENAVPISINRYFNTFHFRLFCTMVGISIAVASRQSTKVNMPLVLDDIFYASDFENRSTVERFVRKLFTLFNKYSQDLPLQLILFTHDQVIFESIIESSSQISEKKDIIFSKLLPAVDSKTKNDFKDLVYQFTPHRPETIIKKVFAIQ